jgi:hypothetical protein
MVDVLDRGSKALESKIRQPDPASGSERQEGTDRGDAERLPARKKP